MAKEAAIGIDLGTTYSAVAVCLHGKVEVIANNQGSRLTPSMVAFTKECRLVGEAANQQKDVDPENTVYDVKRMIGRKYADPMIQQDMAYWPFKVVNVGGRPMVEVHYRNKPRMVNPEEISAMVLQRLKETAEAYLGYKVKDAVITVPAYFNDAQRQATKVAGKIAGLNVLRVLNEPTAAAIAYGLDKESNEKGEMNVVVYDLGGGTFDVSVLTIDGDSIQVRGTAGDTHLGGEDFDNRLLDYMADEFAFLHGKDLGSNKRALRRLKTAVEQAKRALSSYPEATIELDALHEGIDFRSKLSRAKFEELCADLFDYTLKTVDLALTDAGLSKTDIEEVVLVGGCTRTPKIRALLQEFFKVSEINLSLDPEEAVAAGAAIEAAVLNNDYLQNRVLVDVTPLTLGIESSGGLMTPIIPRGTQLPAHVVHQFTTNVDDQTSVTVKIFQGERAMTRDNQLLGVFDLEGIQPAPRGVKTIDVKFDLDFDGILSVAAIEPISGAHERVTIHSDMPNLSNDDIQRLIKEAEELNFEDKEEKERVHARLALDTHVHNRKFALTKPQVIQQLTETEIQAATEYLNSVLKWSNENQYESCDEYISKGKSVEDNLRKLLPNFAFTKVGFSKFCCKPDIHSLQEPGVEEA